MTEDNDLEEKYLASQNDNQKVHVVSDAEGVDQLIQNLSTGGNGGFSKKRMRHKLESGKEGQQDDMLLEMNTRLRMLMGDTAGEQPLSEENMAFQNGEQKVYILPDLTAVEQLRRGVTGKGGEASKSRMWDRGTSVPDNGETLLPGLAGRLQIVEAKLQRLEEAIASPSITKSIEGH